MIQTDDVIKLLLIEHSDNAAEQIASDLRNGGIAVQVTRVTGEAELVEHLRSRTPDLILANMDATQITLKQVSDVLARSGKDSSLIATSKTIDPQRMVLAVESGAWAHVLLGEAELLQHIVRREANSLSTRRAVSVLEASLHESERRCDALLDSSRDPIAYVHEGMHVRANQAYLEMFGFAEDEIEGMSIIDLIAPGDAEKFKSALRRMDKSVKPTQTLDLKAVRTDGATFDAQIELSNASYEGEPCQQIVFRRQAASEEVAKQLEAMRSRDTVTGLYNRQHCLTALTRISSHSGNDHREHALLLIEPDNFKQLTDTLGLDAADLLLSELAHLLQRHLGADDIAGRFGNQTLGMISALSSLEKAEELAEALRRGCEERIFELGAKSVSLTISVGVSLIGSNSNTAAENVLARASEALRAAQGDGGNRIHIIDPAAQEKADQAESLEWRDRIKKALANNGFQLHYQSVVSLQDAPGEFREMLLRMRGPDGDIRPAQFMPAAQKHGLLPAIDRWVIARALLLLGERAFNSQDHTFFIKLSLATLEDESLVPWLTAQIEAKKIRPGAVVFEIPEHGAVTVLKHVLSFVRGIKKLGCRFTLEGFAGSATGLQLLKHTDADYVKIDRTLMQDLPRNKDNESKIRGICAQMRTMDKLTIAEFVEDATSMSILFSCGVDFVQGNFLQEPELVMAEPVSA